MPDAEMRFGGDASGIVAEYRKWENAERSVQREAERTARQIARREDAMQQGMARNSLAMKDLETQGISTFSKLATSIGIVTAATKAWSEVSEHAYEMQKKASGEVKAAGSGLGQLGQLGNTKQLVAEALSLQGSGVTKSVDEAAKMVFQFESGNLSKGDRQIIADLKKWQVIQDAAGTAESLTTLQNAMGKKETGTFEQMISKGFAAAGPSPGEFKDLMTSTAQVAPTAKLAGWSDEQLLASMAVLTKATGKPDRAEPLATNLIKAINEKPGWQGRTIPEIIKDVEGLNMNTAEKRAFFGGKGQALSAYEIIRENQGMYGQVFGEINAATNADLGRAKVAENAQIPQIRALVAAQEAEGKAEQSRAQIGMAQAAYEARIQKYQDGTLLGAANYKANEAFRWLGFGPDSLGKGWGDLFSGGARERQERELSANVPAAQVGPLVKPTDRPYARPNLVIPQVPDDEDPRIVAARADVARAQLAKNEWEEKNFDRYAGADGVMSAKEKSRMGRDPDNVRLTNVLEKLERTLHNVDAKKRLNSAGGLNGGPPK